MYEKIKILIGCSHVKVEKLLHNYTTYNIKTHRQCGWSFKYLLSL